MASKADISAAAVDAKQFPPDQAERWAGIPLDHDQWVHTHNALRKEIRSMIEALDAMAGLLKSDRNVPDWTAGVIYACGRAIWPTLKITVTLKRRCTDLC